MESSAAILQEQASWAEPAQRGHSKRSLAETAPTPVEETIVSQSAIIPVPARVRGRTFLARFGPPIVFALAVAGIIWLWPPF